jgi:hypothetical protein
MSVRVVDFARIFLVVGRDSSRPDFSRSFAILVTGASLS